jgi:hypothetical protein
MFTWLKANKKWLVPTAAATVLVSLLFFVTLHLQQRRKEEQKGPAAETYGAQDAARPVTPDAVRQAAPDPSQEKSPTAADLPPQMIPAEKMAGFSRLPSPEEVTAKIESLDIHERKNEEKKLSQLRVIWPLYFFSLTKRGEDSATVMLDASEDGFGVIIICEINLQRYPGITNAHPGDRIWVAGQIAEVDTHGTGQIVLFAEYFGLPDPKKQ